MAESAEVVVNICAGPLQTGLAGFDMTVRVLNPAIADIVSSTMPDFGLTSINETIPGEIVKLRSVDLKDFVNENADSAILASLAIRGKSPGSTPLLLSVRALDDDKGNVIQPKVADFVLNVSAP